MLCYSEKTRLGQFAIVEMASNAQGFGLSNVLAFEVFLLVRGRLPEWGRIVGDLHERDEIAFVPMFGGLVPIHSTPAVNAG